MRRGPPGDLGRNSRRRSPLAGHAGPDEGLDVSRNTVLAAFRQLIADGHLSAKRGSGVYVAERAQGPPSPQAAEINNSPGSWSTPVQKLPATSPQTSSPLPARLGESTCLPQRTSTLAQLPLSKLYRPGAASTGLHWSTCLARIPAGHLGTAAGESPPRKWGGSPQLRRPGRLSTASPSARPLSAQCARYPLRRGPNRRHGWSTTGPTFNRQCTCFAGRHRCHRGAWILR